jgi:hypothetical protein
MLAMNGATMKALLDARADANMAAAVRRPRCRLRPHMPARFPREWARIRCA